ncbi:MAG: CapA family protein [Firmicutes bacterium]|nr:CapA family protein [Bacillota bacterium]
MLLKRFFAAALWLMLIGSSSIFSEAPVTISLCAAGDVIMHLPVTDSGLDRKSGAYDFRPVFAEIKPLLSEADFSVCVLETPLAVATGGGSQKYTGYPRFNSPAAIADALVWAGIDLAFSAHNHALDQGVTGLLTTLRYYDQIGLLHTGSLCTPDQKRYRMVEVKGVKLAFFSYTESTNGISPPPESKWVINVLDFQKIAADIREAKEKGADCIIMALHAGTEYQREPSPEQRRIAGKLIESGVDIILGSHVHVIQPVELREYIDPVSGKARNCFIAYSLGNLLSNQRWRYSDCGLMVNLKLMKTPDEPGIRIVEITRFPLWVNCYIEKNRRHYRIKPVTGLEEPGPDPNLNEKARQRMREVWVETEALLNNWGNKSGFLKKSSPLPARDKRKDENIRRDLPDGIRLRKHAFSLLKDKGI